MADHRVSKRFRNSTANQQSELTGTNLRKIRVICSDPEATDSSSDEAEDGARSSTRRIVCEIVIGTKPEEEQEPVERKESISSDPTDRKKYTGVRLRKWGKWAAEIHDPFSRKRIWLGTYTTAEEASKAYIAKKEEFQARMSALNRPEPDPVSPVHWKKSARWREMAHEPVTKPEVQPESCTNNPEEEASLVLQSMKHGFGPGYRPPSDSESGSSLKSPKISLSSDGGGGDTISGTTTTTTTSVDDSREETNKPPWFGLGIDMLLIDNNGKLLGQFSRLDDDLRICG